MPLSKVFVSLQQNNKMIDMKKMFVTVLFATLVMAFAACDKENENTAGTHDSVPQEEQQPDIIGTWNTTDNSSMKIYFYRDGSLVDSTVGPIDDKSFVFVDATHVETPWEVPSTYTLTTGTISFTLAGIVTREYLLDDFTANHLAFHRTDTSAYQTVEGADTIDIVGVEYEIWDLAKQVK